MSLATRAKHDRAVPADRETRGLDRTEVAQGAVRAPLCGVQRQAAVIAACALLEAGRQRGARRVGHMPAGPSKSFARGIASTTDRPGVPERFLGFLEPLEGLPKGLPELAPLRVAHVDRVDAGDVARIERSPGQPRREAGHDRVDVSPSPEVCR